MNEIIKLIMQYHPERFVMSFDQDGYMTVEYFDEEYVGDYEVGTGTFIVDSNKGSEIYDKIESFISKQLR